MLPYKRSQRVADLLRQEISVIILERVKDPRLGFLTITDVTMTDDLKIARIYISAYKKEETEKTLSILSSASGFIRKEISRNVRLKYIPSLEFYEDGSLAYGDKIDDLLNNI